jgi:hypothetical protein
LATHLEKEGFVLIMHLFVIFWNRPKPLNGEIEVKSTVRPNLGTDSGVFYVELARYVHMLHKYRTQMTVCKLPSSYLFETRKMPNNLRHKRSPNYPSLQLIVRKPEACGILEKLKTMVAVSMWLYMAVPSHV